ncbi:HdeD family acid-resistance protein [Ancylobacter sp.]|uniref:HdeD family acid-resistance protein n=1 Tax=Ancylobacter sp. TaxID=1872567 RepID=UPI003D0D959A
MLKLAFLLIGAESFRARWYVIAVLGGVFVTLAVLLAIDASDGVTVATQEALGLIFVINGLLALLVFLGRTGGAIRYLLFLKAAALLLVGILIIQPPVSTEWALAGLFGLAFILDGLCRIATALVVRFAGWRTMIAIGAIELAIAGLILTQWPIPHNRNIPFCISMLLALSGWLLFRIGLMFRTLESEAAILSLPLFGGRGWYDNAPVLVETGESATSEHPMIVHVWTPVGSAYAAERRLVVDRYIAALDGHGVISTGHAALEMPPDLYISHYPAMEVERSSEDFIGSLRAAGENDVEGRFQPSYQYESEWWCPADANVEFRNFNPRRLRALWAGYKQDNTYNLTNRNCSVVVAQALDAALEGAMATRFPWLRLLVLLTNPDIWVAAMIRSRANSATWTPGLVLDYARTMARIVEKGEVPWGQRLRGFLKRSRLGPADVNAAHPV